MGRIRALKPEFFLNEELYDLEQETGLPIRLAFEGLWCQADREGRFEWKPRRLKSQILPYDDVDFSRVLDALATRGFLVKYASQGRFYGWIPTFTRHQVINNRERPSELPPPPEEAIEQWKNNSLTRQAREEDASGTRQARVVGAEKRKGREGNKEGVIHSSNKGNGARPPDDSGFEDWWQHVPRKEGKGDARKAYRAALKVADHDTLVAGIKRYAAEVKDSEKQYIKMPAGWLRAERWADEGKKPRKEPTGPNVL